MSARFPTPDADWRCDPVAPQVARIEPIWLAVIGDVDADTAVSKYDLVPGDVRGFDEWLDEAESLAHVPRGSKKMSTWHDRAARELHAAANRTRGD